MDTNSFFPGGRVGYDAFEQGSPEERARAEWMKSGEVPPYLCFADPDFVRAFISSVPDPEEQKKYLSHTMRFIEGKRNGVDPQYVLFFRRTLPSADPKPEQHWTSDYTTARKGLRKEIPGAHRLHSLILCDRLSDIAASGPELQNDATSDGELRIGNTAYDQAACLCRFRPSDQEKELAAYLQTPGAHSLESVITVVREHMQEKMKSKE